MLNTSSSKASTITVVHSLLKRFTAMWRICRALECKLPILMVAFVVCRRHRSPWCRVEEAPLGPGSFRGFSLGPSSVRLTSDERRSTQGHHSRRLQDKCLNALNAASGTAPTKALLGPGGRYDAQEGGLRTRSGWDPQSPS